MPGDWVVGGHDDRVTGLHRYRLQGEHAAREEAGEDNDRHGPDANRIHLGVNIRPIAGAGKKIGHRAPTQDGVTLDGGDGLLVQRVVVAEALGIDLDIGVRRLEVVDELLLQGLGGADLTVPEVDRDRLGELHAVDREGAFDFYANQFGWTKADALDMGEPMGIYQIFSINDMPIGGMMKKMDDLPIPFWLFYINIDDIDAAVARLTEANGKVLSGPHQVPGGSWIVQCTDPEGVIFALEGKRGYSASGYFERVASRDPSGARGRS